ncbi:MAG: T9SS type A sorting domain-containing protein, partial [Bacteroidota bacterium]
TVGQIIPAAGFANFAFQPAPDGNGSPYAEFQFWVSDGDEWSVDAGTITFNVEPINDFPSGSNGEVTAVQDQDFLFSPDDFPFADVDGDMLHAIRIVSPVTKGKLTLNGLDVTANQNIPADELSQLTFTPDPGEFGDNYASFEYRVADDLLLSQEVFTMTIDVNMASGTNEPLAGATVRLSPNPASDAVLVQVETSAALGDVSLEVLDGLGQNLFRLEFSQTGNAFEHELDVSGWAAGVYFVKIQADGAERVLRFLKK